MNIHFLNAFVSLEVIESGYANHPLDKGGETYKGITRRFYPAWGGWDYIDLMKQFDDVFPECLENSEQLQQDVKIFYKIIFWDAIKGDKLARYSPEIAKHLFVISVLHSQKNARLFLQRALNLMNKNQKLYEDLEKDGILGDKTFNALEIFLKNKLNSYLDLRTWFLVFEGERIEKIAINDPTQEVFVKGWIRRARKLFME